MSDRLIVGISGASGAPLAVELLRRGRSLHPELEVHLIVTKGGALTLRQECGMELEELRDLVHTLYSNDSIGAAPASGSFSTLGMLVVPCSMKTVAGIVTGYSDNLLLRAADVTLKERRKLVLAARESPLSTIHLRNLYQASQLGAVIAPPVPAWYRNPQTMDDCARQMVDRLLAQFGLGGDSYQWGGLDGTL